MNISFTQSLRIASNYLVEQRGKCILLVIDSKTIQAKSNSSWLEDILWLHRIGIKLIIVPDLEFYQNQVLTSKDIDQHLAKTQKLFRALQSGLHRYSNSSELVQVELIRCLPVGVIDGTNFEMMGKISHIQEKKLTQLLEGGWIVWQAPLGFSSSGQDYAVTTEGMVTELATVLYGGKMEKVIYLTQDPVLPLDSSVHELSKHELHELLPDNQRCHQLLSLLNHVKRIHLLNSQENGAIIEELFSPDGAGVMIHYDSYDVLESANEEHIQGILELIKPYTQALLPRTKESLDSDIDKYWVMTRDQVVIGCVSINVLVTDDSQPKACELACLVVDKKYQNRGLANLLLKKATKQAKKLGMQKLFTLTTSAKNWFLRKGFEQTSLNELPKNRQAYYSHRRNSIILCRKL